MAFEPAIDGGQFFSPNRDPADFLPPSCGDRLGAVKQRVLDAHALLTPSETLMELHQIRAAHQRRIDDLLKPAGLGGKGLHEDHPAVLDAQRLLAKAKSELKRATELDELRTGRWRQTPEVIISITLGSRSRTDTLSKSPSEMIRHKWHSSEYRLPIPSLWSSWPNIKNTSF
jgi:hypothetical protein